MPLMQWNLSKYQKREMIDQLGKLKEELQKTLRSQEQGSIIPSAALKLYEEEQHLRQKIQEFQTILIPLLKEAYIKEKSSRRNNDKALRKELPRKIKAMKKKQEEMQIQVRAAMYDAHKKRREAMHKAAEQYATTMTEAAEKRKKAA